MKRYKKLIAYILVGVLVSSSVFVSYDKAKEVKAIAIADDALIMATILGAMGIVFIGSNWYGSNLAEDWETDYEDELMEQEGELIELWDNAIWQAYANGSIPNPDDFDPEEDEPEDKPPTYENLKAYIQANPTTPLTISNANLITGIFATVASALLKNAETGQYYESGLVSDEVYTKLKDYLVDYPYMLCARHTGWDDTAIPYIYLSSDPINVYTTSSGTSVFMCSSKYTSSSNKGSVKVFANGNYAGSTSYYDTSENFGYDWKPVGGNVGIYVSHEEAHANLTDTITYPSKINPNTVKTATATEDGFEYGGINFPVNSMLTVGQSQMINLLNNLYNAKQLSATEQEVATQSAIDEFVGGIEPSTDVEVNPDVGTGEDTGTDTEENPDVNNSSFVADLKHLFPFCIPFDLVDCFRLFNAEPETPRLEVPMHFGIVDVDYTWVIDLSDFDEVAMLCRSSFLILFIVGLVLATRGLIRG